MPAPKLPSLQYSVRPELNAFSLFALFYMTAFLMHMMEKWKYPGFTLISGLIVVAIVATRINRVKFLGFLIFSTIYFLFFRFPDVANHVNFFIYCNILMMVSMVYTFAYPNRFSSDEDYYQMIRPLLQASLIILYFLAGFHKFNSDFLNPQVGCSLGMLEGISYHLGFPISIADAFPNTKDVLIISVSLLALAWELIAGLFLWFPRLQGPILLFSWLMHAIFSINGFVDFGSLIFAFFFTFIPSNHYQALQKNAYLRVKGITVHRAYLYFGISLLLGLITAIHFKIHPVFPRIKLLAAILFNIAVVIYAYPIFYARFLAPQKLAWRGVRIFNTKTPKFMFLFLLLLLLFGITPYLGLRTAGTFSMFSNLRTEGTTSNHFLLGNNSLKIWNHQEDVVKFIEIDDDRAKIGHQYKPLKGHWLPVVEFKKLIYQWTKARYTVPMKFDYRGQIYDTKDITQDPNWLTPTRTWEMKLMDFRVIQPEGDTPNQCRW